MKVIFYFSILFLLAFEFLRVYFIMPMPGIAQQVNSIDWAYFLHSWRWIIRIVLFTGIFAGLVPAFRKSWWPASIGMLAAGVGMYVFNFIMTADAMFYQPHHLLMADRSQNIVPEEKLVLGVNVLGHTKAYPIQYIAYHHQVIDTIGGERIMVTYCSVCRSGRVFHPSVRGKDDDFRLVGMDHFNAMFEDSRTGSWWRQANGEAIVGKLKGESLPEIFADQTTLKEWLLFYPNSLIMQPDTDFLDKYKKLENYDEGYNMGILTHTDTASWQEKSWVVGIVHGKTSKAYDWNRLKKETVINDFIGDFPVVIALAEDHKSFFAYQRPSDTILFTEINDSLVSDTMVFDLMGHTASGNSLKPVLAYQEFWHSWRTFHPATERY